MYLESLQKFFASSPAVRLIRSPHAFWIVDFLNQQFKLAGRITASHSELAAELESYLDRLSRSKSLDRGSLESGGKSDSREMADSYLSGWCSSSIGWLKRYIDETSSEPCYQLTAEFEKALAFVEKSSQEVGFIGTESRLKTILELLGNVVAGVSQDPQFRLNQLEMQRDELDLQIKQLRSSPEHGRMTSTQVRERFNLASQQLHQLKSEFRAVEDRFKSITREVQQRILAADDSRGDILQFALDSEDMLKQGDQGKSFFEFLKLLHAPESQDKIAALVEQLHEIDEIASERSELSALREMVPTLIAEAEKILRTTQHLSLTLRRLLDTRSTRHHQQLSQVLRDILGAAARQSESPPADLGIEVEVEMQIQSPMDRPFWSATDPFDDVELQHIVAEPADQRAAFQELASLKRLDWQTMRQRITAQTELTSQVSLPSLLQRYPIEAGVVEILGYLQIAHDDGHLIDRSQTVSIPASDSGSIGRALRLPQVVFLEAADRQDGARATNQLKQTNVKETL